VVWVFWSWWGPLAALLPALLLWRHYLFWGLVGQARSDALETLAVTATLPILAVLWRRDDRIPRAWLCWGGVLGLLSAIAFQTRLNGLIAFGMVMVVLGADYLTRRRRGPLIGGAAACAVFLVVSVALNPFYWANPKPESASLVAMTADGALPVRVIHRFGRQVASLQRQLELQPERWRLRTVGSRIGFASSVLTSGKAGKVALLGALLLVPMMFRGQAEDRRAAQLVGLSCGVMIAVFAVWVPLAWDPYVLVILPAWIAVGSAGLVLATRFARRALRRA
jgi:hypothetical protein